MSAIQPIQLINLVDVTFADCESIDGSLMDIFNSIDSLAGGSKDDKAHKVANVAQNTGIAACWSQTQLKPSSLVMII